MVVAPITLPEEYWIKFELQEQDVEFIYTHLLEIETPLTSHELTTALVRERVKREKLAAEQQRSSGAEIYRPKEKYALAQTLVFPALGWRRGEVINVRPGQNPEVGDFEVIQVAFDEAEKREFAARLPEHVLNQPPQLVHDDASLDPVQVLSTHGELLEKVIESELEKRADFVRIAGRWFPRALLVDINAGHLNLAEAVLDMAGGGPQPTSKLLEQVGLRTDVNSNLVEFSLDLALQEDPRFDEVGPAGQVLWFLHRLEPEEVLQVPYHLRHQPIDYDRNMLDEAMQALERELDDELSPVEGKFPKSDEIQLKLIYPHWRAGTLPLSGRMRHLFPTAYEAPRIRFVLVDGDSGEQFPGWVIRGNRYVTGLRKWYDARGLTPGSLIWVRQGETPGEVIIQCNSRRPSREWVRTVLVGSDGGVVFAMLKQAVSVAYDERMTMAIPDPEAMDLVWQRMQKERAPFERVVVNIVRELAKLNPQSHVHASELYAAVNTIRRCPPGPILALLASRPWFVHVGDLHFRFDDSERG